MSAQYLELIRATGARIPKTNSEKMELVVELNQLRKEN
jgi:hypothetical protein